MANFVKLTTIAADGNYLRIWVHPESIEQLSQKTGSQDGENKGTCLLTSGTTIELIAFNETLDSLK